MAPRAAGARPGRDGADWPARPAVVHLGRAVDATFFRHGLQRGEYDVLAALRSAGGPFTLTPSELSDSVMLSRAGMTNRLDRLESAGLVFRRSNRDDRRTMHIDLTTPAVAIVDEVTTEHVANENELLSGLTAATVGR